MAPTPGFLFGTLSEEPGAAAYRDDFTTAEAPTLTDELKSVKPRPRAGR